MVSVGSKFQATKQCPWQSVGLTGPTLDPPKRCHSVGAPNPDTITIGHNLKEQPRRTGIKSVADQPT